ncbi:unnamed protein product, partial [Ectocarpus sp. 12 AP-2014]
SSNRGVLTGPRRYGEASPVGGRDRPPLQPPGADASHVRRGLRHGGGGSDAPGGVETRGAKECRQPGEDGVTLRREFGARRGCV